MADDGSTPPILAELRAQLEESRQQEERLKDTLTRVLSLMDDLGRP